MWSEEIDKKIKAAAENEVHSSYQEKTWDNMEALLDKHLPQKRKRRGIIIFFLAAGLAISGYLLINTISSNNTADNKNLTKQEDNSSTAGQGTNKKQQDETAPSITGSGKENSTEADNTNSTISSTSTNKIINADNTSVAPDKKNTNNQISGKKKNSAATQQQLPAITSSASNTDIQNKSVAPAIVKEKPVTDNDITITNTSPDKSGSPAISADQKAIAPAIVADQPNPTTQTQNIADKKNENSDPATVASNEPVKKESKSKISKLSFTASFGPDLSGTGINNPGQVKAQFGIGAAYAISERFSVRTGIYAGRKIYSADSTQYHTPYTSGPYTFKLYNVDANCLVYEIPVNVVYNFKQSKNHNWFISGGLSSYLMKDESYVYNYKSNSGMLLSHTYRFTNENSHIFSILNLSGGYQYHFSKRFSLLAEPYIKLPLSGIGEGSVRLNSAGVLFTASLRPFSSY